MSDDTSDLAVVANEESPVLRRIEVTVAQPRVERAYDRAYRDIARNARVKGFRPGKVPRAVLEKLYGASLGEEIERMLVNETLGAALAQAGVEPVATPSVDATPPQRGEAFRYKALVEVRPAIELPALEGLPGKRPVVLVVQDIDRLELRARVPETALRTVHEQSELQVTFPALDETRTVRVKRIAPTVDPRTRTIEIVAEVENGDHRLKAGMLAEVAYGTPTASAEVAEGKP